jgi:hypothetical protein
MKNVVFWDAALCRSCVNRRFGGTYRFHFQGRKSASEEPVRHLQPPARNDSSLADFSILKMEAILSSEISVNTRPTQRHIPEDDILRDSYVGVMMEYGLDSRSSITARGKRFF